MLVRCCHWCHSVLSIVSLLSFCDVNTVTSVALCTVRTITGGGAHSWQVDSLLSTSSSTVSTSTPQSSRLKDSSARSSTSDTHSSCAFSSSSSLVTSFMCRHKHDYFMLLSFVILFIGWTWLNGFSSESPLQFTALFTMWRPPYLQ